MTPSMAALLYCQTHDLTPGERGILLGLAMIQDVEVRPWVRPVTVAEKLGMSVGNARQMLVRPRLASIIDEDQVPFGKHLRVYRCFRIRPDWRIDEDRAHKP